MTALIVGQGAAARQQLVGGQPAKRARRRAAGQSTRSSWLRSPRSRQPKLVSSAASLAEMHRGSADPAEFARVQVAGRLRGRLSRDLSGDSKWHRHCSHGRRRTSAVRRRASARRASGCADAEASIGRRRDPVALECLDYAEALASVGGCAGARAPVGAGWRLNARRTRCCGAADLAAGRARRQATCRHWRGTAQRGRRNPGLSNAQRRRTWAWAAARGDSEWSAGGRSGLRLQV